MDNIKYAVYPGSITLYDGTVVTMAGVELATAYGVQDEPYLEITSIMDIPAHESYLDYIHLKMRADNIYRNIKDIAQDDGNAVTWGRDFDGDKTYTQETKLDNIDKDKDLPHN